MRIPRQITRRAKGFTLVEATAAILVTLALAGIGLALVSQQVFFQRALSQQRFVAEDGPVTSNLLSRIINRADRFLIHASAGDARSGTGVTGSGGDAVVLTFRNPGGTMSRVMIAEEQQDGQTVLNYYHSDGSTWPATPSWTVSKSISDVDFSLQNGILLVTITGPNGGQLSFSGSSQL